MIVEVDFLDHPKTLRLEKMVGPRAVHYVLRLWTYCQNRRTDRLKIEAEDLASICRFDDDPAKLLEAMLRCGFVDSVGNELVVHDWADTNERLMTRWKGGETTKRKAQERLNAVKPPANTNQVEALNELSSKAQTTQADCEKSREEKRREEGKSPPPLFVAAQYAEAQLALSTIALKCFNTTLPASGSVEDSLFMDSLSGQLPVSADGLEDLIWFYLLPRDDPIFQDPRHPGLTSRRRSLKALVSNLRAECDKAVDARKNVAAALAAAERKEQEEQYV